LMGAGVAEAAPAADSADTAAIPVVVGARP
jgi:hypothetical protein